MIREKPVSIAFKQHDHNVCSQRALQLADEYCEEHVLRLTPARRKVLELLLKEHRALGAYAIMDLLREAGFNSQPPVAYRALDFLVEHGFAHKIEGLNAFVACAHPNTAHSSAFMICRQCDTVAETQFSLSNFDLSESAIACGFKIEQTVVEAKGICQSCAGIE